MDHYLDFIFEIGIISNCKVVATQVCAVYYDPNKNFAIKIPLSRSLQNHND